MVYPEPVFGASLTAERIEPQRKSNRRGDHQVEQPPEIENPAAEESPGIKGDYEPDSL